MTNPLGRLLRRRWAVWTLLGSGLVLLFCGCETARYYSQAIQGHAQILARQRPISKILADPAAPAPLKEPLELLLQLRSFAATNLLLPPNGHYLRYADLGRPYVVWNVYAAPEFSVEDHTWWYPFVGRLSYRGYFKESGAQRSANRLRARGLDAYVEGVQAYSTLGWFRDPALNTFIHLPEAHLAELIFHELAHQRLFVKGDTDFNEAFATAVAEEGVERWLRAMGREEELTQWTQAQARQRQFTELVLEARTELEQAYRTPAAPGAALAERRRRKAELIQELRRRYLALKQQWNGYAGYDRWFAQPINNAQINTVATYYEWVPGFRAVLEQSGRNLGRFYERVESMAELSKRGRREQLAAAAAGVANGARLEPVSARD